MRRRQIRRFERLETRRLLAVTVDNLPATDISFDSATIGVDVQDFDAFTPTISLFWGQADGGTDFNGWENREQMGERELGQHEVIGGQD